MGEIMPLHQLSGTYSLSKIRLKRLRNALVINGKLVLIISFDILSSSGDLPFASLFTFLNCLSQKLRN